MEAKPVTFDTKDKATVLSRELKQQQQQQYIIIKFSNAGIIRIIITSVFENLVIFIITLANLED